LTEERRREIVNLLDREGRVTIGGLCKTFGISAVTARSDLDALHSSGVLLRSHGGGIRPAAASPDFPVNAREAVHREEKQRIAQAAAALIRPFQTVIIGAGTTCAALADQIRREPLDHLTVVTYALNIALRLADAPNISLMLIGGIVRHVSNALVGPQAEQMISGLHADHYFLSAVGVDATIGLTTLDILEAQLNTKLLSTAKEVTILADSTKLGNRSLSLVCAIDPQHRIITDSNASEETLMPFREQGVAIFAV
jgi:DeoR/GlpR family transcriptional regulator of sugar metabolism